VLDVINNYLGVFEAQGFVFQVGLLPFIVQLGFVSWRYINHALEDAERSRILSLEMSALSSSLEHQQQLFEKLSSDNTEVRRLRHDLRHQLSALRGLVLAKKDDEAISYIDSISDEIPKVTDMYLCENFAINALCVHYLNSANAKNIQTEVNLVVPKIVGKIADNDLNIIIGNLFENAIEACEYVEESKRFIKLQTRVDGKRFMLMIDNGFDGNVKVNNGIFYSRKRNGKGVGTASVKAVVAKYNGTVKFETAADTFKVSLYFTI
jgi:sensor histidine kinase regulating citrate/malate metabolism